MVFGGKGRTLGGNLEAGAQHAESQPAPGQADAKPAPAPGSADAKPVEIFGGEGRTLNGRVVQAPTARADSAAASAGTESPGQGKLPSNPEPKMILNHSSGGGGGGSGPSGPGRPGKSSGGIRGGGGQTYTVTVDPRTAPEATSGNHAETTDGRLTLIGGPAEKPTTQSLGTGEHTATGQDTATGQHTGSAQGTGISQHTAAESASGSAQHTAMGQDTGSAQDTATGQDTGSAQGTSAGQGTGISQHTAAESASGSAQDTATGQETGTAQHTATGQDTATGPDIRTGQDTAISEHTLTEPSAASAEHTATRQDAATLPDTATRHDTATVHDAPTATDVGAGQQARTVPEDLTGQQAKTSAEATTATAASTVGEQQHEVSNTGGRSTEATPAQKSEPQKFWVRKDGELKQVTLGSSEVAAAGAAGTRSGTGTGSAGAVEDSPPAVIHMKEPGSSVMKPVQLAKTEEPGRGSSVASADVLVSEVSRPKPIPLAERARADTSGTDSQVTTHEGNRIVQQKAADALARAYQKEDLRAQQQAAAKAEQQQKDTQKLSELTAEREKLQGLLTDRPAAPSATHEAAAAPDLNQVRERLADVNLRIRALTTDQLRPPDDGLTAHERADQALAQAHAAQEKPDQQTPAAREASAEAGAERARQAAEAAKQVQTEFDAADLAFRQRLADAGREERALSVDQYVHQIRTGQPPVVRPVRSGRPAGSSASAEAAKTETGSAKTVPGVGSRVRYAGCRAAGRGRCARRQAYAGGWPGSGAHGRGYAGGCAATTDGGARFRGRRAGGSAGRGQAADR